MRDDLIITLDNLLTKKRDIDLILVETNGLANPAEVVNTFWLDDKLECKVELHMSVGVVDALNFYNAFDEHKDLLIAQLIQCDKIMLNKTDLVPEEEREERLSKIEDEIRQLNPSVEIIRT